LLAGVLHVLAEVRAPGAGEDPGGHLLRVLHRHARVGKGYEEFAERIKAEGTFTVRGRTAKVTEVSGQMVVTGEDLVSDRLVQFPVDMVLLAVGLVPPKGSEEVARMLGIARDEDGWFSELDYNGDPVDTERGGVVSGARQAPDIPDTVAQAAAAAAGVLKTIQSGRGVDSRSTITLSDIEARAQHLHMA
jgi:heterodisulfide reductase subunit A-like polyferredoxin